MSWADNYEPWFDLGNDIRNTARHIVGTVDLKYSPMHGLNDPPIHAAALLFRTLRSCRASFSLARSGDLVEASILARSCVENALWLRGLQQRGLDFVKDILEDGMRAEASVAELMLKMPSIELDEQTQEIALAQIKEKTTTYIRTDKISNSEEARSDYALFRLLSNGYAHPSIRSLNFHVVSNPQTGRYELDMEPTATPRELLGTLLVSANATLISIGLFLETFPTEERARFNSLGHNLALSALTQRLDALGREEELSGPNA